MRDGAKVPHGIIGELVRQGVQLLLVDVQKDAIHAPDYIFERERLPICLRSKKYL